ncbi:MAG: PqqD family protein [Beijerinckiaceae bacterium]
MRIQLTPGTTLTLVEGKSVLFSVRTGDSFGLNEIAAEMLRLGMENGLDAATEQLARDYDAPAEEIRADIEALAQDLVRLKFAQLAPAQGS